MTPDIAREINICNTVRRLPIGAVSQEETDKMDKFTLTRALRTQLQQAPDRDLRVEEATDETRILDDFELTLAAGGDDIPQW